MGLKSKSKPQKAPPSQAEQALFDVSRARWNHYVRTYTPAEAQLIEQSKMTEGEITAVEGGIAGDAAAVATRLNKQTVGQVAPGTGGVTSGATKIALAANADSRASSIGQGRALGRAGAIESELDTKVALASAGQGVASTVTDSLSAATSRATRLSIAAAEARAQKNAARAEAFGTIAGALFRNTKLGKKAAEGKLFQQDELVTLPDKRTPPASIAKN